MSYNTFFKKILDGAHVGIIVFAAGWVLEKIHDQNEEIEEMLSWLEDCEEKRSQCKENYKLKE